MPPTKTSLEAMLQQSVMPGATWWHAANVELGESSPSTPRTLVRSPEAGGTKAASSDASMGSRPAEHGLIGANGLHLLPWSTRHLGPELRRSWRSSTAACFSCLANCIATGGAGGGEERGVRSPAEALLLGVANDRPSGAPCLGERWRPSLQAARSAGTSTIPESIMARVKPTARCYSAASLFYTPRRPAAAGGTARKHNLHPPKAAHRGTLGLTCRDHPCKAYSMVARAF